MQTGPATSTSSGARLKDYGYDLVIPIIYAENDTVADTPGRRSSLIGYPAQIAPSYAHVRPPAGVSVIEMSALKLDIDLRLPTSSQPSDTRSRKRPKTNPSLPLAPPQHLEASSESVCAEGSVLLPSSNSLLTVLSPERDPQSHHRGLVSSAPVVHEDQPGATISEIDPGHDQIKPQRCATAVPLQRILSSASGPLSKRSVDSSRAEDVASELGRALAAHSTSVRDVLELVDAGFRSLVARKAKHSPRTITVLDDDDDGPTLAAMAPGLWSPGYLQVNGHGSCPASSLLTRHSRPSPKERLSSQQFLAR